MKRSTNVLSDQEVIEQINRIVALRLKTLIINSLSNEDFEEFRKIASNKNPDLLLAFAHQKVPSLAQKITTEFENISKEVNIKIQKYG